MLSGVIIAWNEAVNLPVAIESLNGLVDEVVVVVDEASTDDTFKLAKDMGCKVFKHAHSGIVEPMRNFAISKAKGDWILLLDADEEVSPGLSQKITEILKNPKADFYKVPRKNIIFGKWIISNHWWPDFVFRLFKKEAIKWDKTIHSLPFTRGEGIELEADSEIAIIHHNYKSVSEYLGKLDRYTEHLKLAVIANGHMFSILDLITKPIDEFNNQFFARKGYRDGIHGLILALLQSFTELVIYLKIWEVEGRKDTPIASDELDKELKLKTKEFGWWNYQMKINEANPLVKIWLKIARRLGV